jgi:hypothetical protein
MAPATHFLGKTFEGPRAQKDCEAFLKQARKEGREGAKNFGGSAGEYNQTFNLRCRDNGDGTFTTVGSNGQTS